MADTTTRRTVIVDANIIINLIHVERLAFFCDIPDYDFVVPEDVVAEIVQPAQRARLDGAIADGHVRVETISAPSDLLEYAELRRSLGRGEAACLVLAKRLSALIASDERGRFQRQAIGTLGIGGLVNTAGLFVLAIRAGLLSVEEADNAKAVLERHRFRMHFSSFRDIVSGTS